jgi:hypothetical protein
VSDILEKRLQKLEAEVARRQANEAKLLLKPLRLLVRYCIGHYLVEPRPDEAPLVAYLRALGYRDYFEYKQAAERNIEDVNERYRQALRRLFAKFGVDLDIRSARDSALDALDSMEAGLPEPLRMRLRKIEPQLAGDAGSWP